MSEDILQGGPIQWGWIIRDIAALSELIKDAQAIPHKAALRGIRCATDDARLLLALCPPRNDIDLEMKSAVLLGGLPMMDEHVNLIPMIEAALVADVQRIRPGHLPYELRAKFRT